MLSSQLEELLRVWILGQGYQLVEDTDWPVAYTNYFKNLPPGDEIGVVGEKGNTRVLFTVTNTAWKTALSLEEIEYYRVRMVQGGFTQYFFLYDKDGVLKLTK